MHFSPLLQIWETTGNEGARNATNATRIGFIFSVLTPKPQGHPQMNDGTVPFKHATFVMPMGHVSSTSQWNAAIIHVISYTCACLTMTKKSAVKKGLLSIWQVRGVISGPVLFLEGEISWFL